MKTARLWLTVGSVAIAALAAAAMGASALGSPTAAMGLIALGAVVGIGFLLLVSLTQQAGQAAAIEAAGVVATRKRDDERRRERASLLAFIDSVPHAVALVLPDGKVEMANSRAATFGLEPGKNVSALETGWLRELVNRAIATRDRAAPAPGTGFVQHFEEGREAFFLPAAIPLINGKGDLDGITVVLVDVTATRHAHEAKSNFMSSFSHELKTPMTSLQMSIYLLLDDAADRLTPRQLDLLKSAREDADRLHRLMEEVLAAARKKN
ncbi:MAG TPA: histidine kinase dimerization/phospho-acceptor domain-containing protein [Phycisphaerae bacterium]|jgi:signal transduction histidine kinase|nr:histidine kinase dimerization/phospho-acceptor domain-containing protein [Phycisphaerae bacterium]